MGDELLLKSRSDDDEAVFAGTHIGIFSIDDLVIHMNFHFVGAGGDVQYLRLIIVRHCLSGLHAIDEHERARRGASHNDLRGIRWLRGFAQTEPTAGGKPSQCYQHEDSHSVRPMLELEGASVPQSIGIRDNPWLFASRQVWLRKDRGS